MCLPCGPVPTGQIRAARPRRPAIPRPQAAARLWASGWPCLIPGTPRTRVLRAQRGYFFLKVRQRLESAVDRGEPQVGHLIKIAKRAEDGQANLVRGNLAAATAPDRVLYPLSQDRQLVLRHRPALAGTPHAADNLVPVERLSDAAALGHHQDDCLLRGKPAPARLARPAAADRGAVFGGPAVDHPAVGMPAVRAVHAITPPLAELPEPSGAFRAQPIEKLQRCNY